MKFEEMTPVMQKRLVALAEGRDPKFADGGNWGRDELRNAGLETQATGLSKQGIDVYRSRHLARKPIEEEETSLVRFQPRAYTIMGFALILATILGVSL